MSARCLIRGGHVFAAADQPAVRDGAVVVDGDSILEVLPFAEAQARHPGAAVLGSPAAAVLPGLINAHHHGQAATSIQMGLPEDLLEPWLLSWAGTRDRDRYLDTLLSGAKLLGSGVTTTVDIWSDGSEAAVYAESIRAARRGYGDAGIRVCFAPGIKTQSFIVWGAGEDGRFIDSLPPTLRPRAESLLPARTLDEDDYFAVMAEIGRETAGDTRFDLWFEFPGPQWVSDDFMQRIAEAAASADTGLQTHVNESLYEKLHGLRFYGRDTMLHLEALGVLSPRFSIAHGCWLTEAEIIAMVRTGAAISHNPGSNLRLHAGIAPVLALCAAGVTVGLGMDATTLNDDEDMFGEMRLALRLNRDPTSRDAGMSPADVLALATLGGAKLIRKEDRLGRLASGYAADLVVVDLGRARWPWTAPEGDPLALCLLRASRRDVDLVMVDGEVVWRDKAPTRFDIREAGQAFAERMAAQPVPAERAETVRRLLSHLRDWYGAWDHPVADPYTAYNSRI
ncbi:MAG TPA: amidohydrolase family protein [Bauldia sp.]|nr:amidohydrolase family protein [Bauldia sp.]